MIHAALVATFWPAVLGAAPNAKDLGDALQVGLQRHMHANLDAFIVAWKNVKGSCKYRLASAGMPNRLSVILVHGITLRRIRDSIHRSRSCTM